MGGETAEMPTQYPNNEYDVVGFCNGIVERTEIIDGSKIVPGDAIIGIASNGIHCNGYSLINDKFSIQDVEDNLEYLVKPTKIYANPIKMLLRCYDNTVIKGIAHITGGGLYDNIPRILPQNCKATLYFDSWQVPEIFFIIQDITKLDRYEMCKIFNYGIGMVLVTPQTMVNIIIEVLENLGEKATVIGEIEEMPKPSRCEIKEDEGIIYIKAE